MATLAATGSGFLSAPLVGMHPPNANAFEIVPQLNVEPEFTPPPIQVTAYGGLLEPQREGMLTFLVDGGANGHFLNRQGAALIENSTTVSTVQQAVSGIGKRSTALVAEKYVSPAEILAGGLRPVRNAVRARARATSSPSPRSTTWPASRSRRSALTPTPSRCRLSSHAASTLA